MRGSRDTWTMSDITKKAKNLIIGTKPEGKSITNGDVTSEQSEGLSVVLLQLTVYT